MSSPDRWGRRTSTPLAAVFGCRGAELEPAERAFFADANPLGFILFERNCRSPDQARALVDAFKDCVARTDAPVLIDQEGGRVARLGPPHWTKPPAAARFAELGARDMIRAREAARLGARLMAEDLRAIGVSVDCAPVLDVSRPETHRVIGDRAYGSDPEQVAQLGRAVVEGLLAGGVLPMIKHIPGHGRARVDSHLELPRVDAQRAELERVDFVPFRALRDAPWGMSAHILYSALDPSRPATLSADVIEGVIRRDIGFDGLLSSDDLSMKALGGTLGERARAALAAGCDVVLHCNGRLDEMEQVATGARPLRPESARRLARAERARRAPEPVDAAAAGARHSALLAGA